MILINKNHLNVELDSNISLGSMSSIIYSKLTEWDYKFNSSSKAQFLEEADILVTSISFILGTITTGFLKQIGEEVWYNVKNIFYNCEKEKRIPGFKFKFNYEDIDVTVELESEDPEVLENVLNNLNVILKQVLKEEDHISEMKFRLDKDSERLIRID
ncbi:hypothetical protein C7959_14417 [Orenia marismortui]|uniref:Uncharacterized protein n=2 Tax=Orenia marismortui TaxID=46469 RepID=A0A4R8GIL5_9FIRM|nr:hypothetical protein C7959_14417 [Orenia marismortui]